ncbi:MAG: addiction module protein [Prolixibacteraceae bacterium]|nr:addiction module protein [Prolixibacteraceae bacterium]
MNLQFISDSKGQTTGVFIPINEWNELKNKYKGLDQDEMEIPSWHMDILMVRIADYEKNPEQALDFEKTMDEIENKL